jgi:hypothetical protein
MPYNPNTNEYQGIRPEVGQTYWVQSLLIQNYSADKYIAIDKEIRGGLHRVTYKSHLTVTDKYDGIFNSRRVKGMLVYVELEDDDTPCDKYFSLKQLPGTSISDWEEIGSGSPVTVNNPQTVANLNERSLLEPEANDFVNVTDARTQEQIDNEDEVYSQSFIYNGTDWLIIYPYGQDPNRHVKNTDTQLIKGDGNPLTADDINTHITSTSVHKLYNDSNDDGSETEAWTSYKVKTELDKKIDIPVDGNGDLFLSQDGSYKAVTSISGVGLQLGDILKGGNSEPYDNEIL